MADVCANKISEENLGINLGLEKKAEFTGADLSIKLNLLGCDVAYFGDNAPRRDDPDISDMVWSDIPGGIYRKLFFNKDQTRLCGDIMVGDASDYSLLHTMCV